MTNCNDECTKRGVIFLSSNFVCSQTNKLRQCCYVLISYVTVFFFVVSVKFSVYTRNI